MPSQISPREVEKLLSQGGEVAFLDLREAGPFSEGHPLFATPCPWSALEAEVTRLVPRTRAPVILIDGGDGVARLGAQALAGLGYTDVSVVEGGAPGWKAAGLTLFKGVHVPSKTLGELAEEVMHPKALSPAELSEWMKKGRDFLFFDTRPAGEHRKMTVPGAVCLPNGELPHRLETVPPDKPIVVTCAGRTRGIIGAASMGLVAPEREVFWLEDGTQGWTLSGRELQYGNAAPTFDTLAERPAAATRRRAQAFIARHGLSVLSAEQVAAMRSEEGRTTYLFDVRSPEEAQADPIPAFLSAPLVELVQATDRHIAIRNARVVLADDLGLRAALAAFWLRAMGFEVGLALISDELRRLEPGSPPCPAPPALPRVSADPALWQAAAGMARLIDLRSSGNYTSGHVARATWSIRPRLGAIPPTPERLFLIGDHSARADLAGQTLLGQGRLDVAVVEGGLPALIAAGAEIVTGQPMDLPTACDVTSFAHGRHEGDRDASRLYLAWEKGLVAQLSDAQRRAFRI